MSIWQKGIDRAREEMSAAKATAEPADFMKHAGLVFNAAMKFKKGMIDSKLGTAKAICPKCKVSGALHGRLITGKAAGRHQRSGGAFRMWCDNCPDVRMLE